MARVTVENCIDKVANRFELVALAAKRAKDISAGAPVVISSNRDKNTVIALREIEKGLLKKEDLREDIIYSLQSNRRIDSLNNPENLHAEGDKLNEDQSDYYGESLNEDNYSQNDETNYSEDYTDYINDDK